MKDPRDFYLEKKQIAHQFSRAASTYDQVADLQRTMAQQLIAKIPEGAQGTLVDFGCGTGYALGMLLHHTGLDLVGIDLAPGMIEVARQNLPSRVRLMEGDFEDSGLDSGSIDFLLSNAAMQWSDLSTTLNEMNRVLRPQGRLLVSTFGPATMIELKRASESIGEAPRVHSFVRLEEMYFGVSSAGFEIESIASDHVVVSYDSADELLRSHKQLGGTNAMPDRRAGMMGKNRYRRLLESIERTRNSVGKICLTFETVFVFATKVESIEHLETG